MIMKKTHIKLLFLIALAIILLALIFITIRAVEISVKNYIEEKNKFFSFQDKVNSYYSQQIIFNKQKPLLEKLIKTSFMDENQEEAARLAQFIADLENTAEKHKVFVEITNVNRPVEATPYYLFQFTLEGKFPNILKFMYAMEDSPFKYYRLMEFQKIKIEKVSSSCENNDSKCKEINVIKGEAELRVYTKVKK
jgi:hypothetical protein